MALQKLQCFFTKVMGPYRFFEGSRLKFFCRVNGLYVSAFQLDYYNDSISGYEVLPMSTIIQSLVIID